MGIEESIKELFNRLIAQHSGNNAAAAASIGVNPVTFWGWMNNKRGLNHTLCQAIDRAGGILLIPGDSVPAGGGKQSQSSVHQEGVSPRVAELESTVAKLQAELAATRTERDEARGEVRALERQLARLTPTHEERNESLPDSTGDIRGEAVRAG